MKKLLTRTRRTVFLFPKRFTMKILLLYFLTSSSIFQASERNPKNLISLNAHNITIEQLFDEVELSTNYRFVYRLKDLDVKSRVSINVRNEKIETVLDNVLNGIAVNYTINGKQIILKKIDANSNPWSVTSGIKDTGQNSVSGLVTNELGNAFPGVYVVKKNTNDGTLSDLDGNYSINASPNDTLVFSYLGYTTVSRVVGVQTAINVQMQQSTSELSEVIINGIFERKAESFTGSAVTFTKEELSRVGNQNIFQTIQNIDPSIAILVNFQL